MHHNFPPLPEWLELVHRPSYVPEYGSFFRAALDSLAKRESKFEQAAKAIAMRPQTMRRKRCVMPLFLPARGHMRKRQSLARTLRGKARHVEKTFNAQRPTPNAQPGEAGTKTAE